MIKLEPFTPQDFERFISWINNKEILTTIAGNYFSYPVTISQLQNYLNDENSHSFNIIDQSQHKIIGHAEICRSGDANYKIDKLIIGDTSNRGKGIGQKVMQQLVDYAFIQLHVQTVELNVFDWNTNAIRCYEKTGFIINQNKTASFKVDDKTWIALNMSIDKDDWLASKVAST